MILPQSLFWDSCVFIRWLTDKPDDYVKDIEQFIEDAKRGRLKIYYSTIAFAEIRPRYLKAGHGGSINRLFAELGSAFIPIDPNPNILISAGRLRDASVTNPGDPRIADDKKRIVSTADAIQLMTCIYARDVLEISDILFHTFDDGKGGKFVPLLSFEKWFDDKDRMGVVEDVCSLTRSLPKHPSPDLVTATGAAIPPPSQRH